jgi:hypothetical protein
LSGGGGEGAGGGHFDVKRSSTLRERRG